MKKPVVAVVSFPGMNCEVESLRAVRKSGMEVKEFRWNDSREKLKDVDGYFLPGGFSYEDRGRAGMIAAHDPLMDFLREESKRGKVIIGNCNGAQILVESGLIPFGEHLDMALARNRIPDFFNEWVWIKRTCARDRCATSDWEICGEPCRTMLVPIAHGEGRFTTRDPDLIGELKKNDQIAFQYCDKDGNVSEASNPNGSVESIAGICNPAGNVVALMPHPERTANGDPYFLSLKSWLQKK